MKISHQYSYYWWSSEAAPLACKNQRLEDAEECLHETAWAAWQATALLGSLMFPCLLQQLALFHIQGSVYFLIN